MNSNKSVKANFELNEYKLTITSPNGSVTKFPDQTTYTYGTVVTLTAIPNIGYRFIDWTGSVTNPTISSTTIVMDKNKAVSVRFLRHYEVRTLAELQSIAGGDLEGYYILMNDIDASDTTQKGFLPIGSHPTSPDTTSFRGVFDGNGKRIINLMVNQNTSGPIGLFSIIGEKGEVRNLIIENGKVISRDSEAGGLVGLNRGSISDCLIIGDVIYNGDSDTYMGGLVGYNGGTITCSFSTGRVRVVSQRYMTLMGGLVGKNSSHGKIRNCISSAHILGEPNIWGWMYAGGLIGINEGTVDQSFFVGIVGNTGGNFCGGLIGGNSGGSVTNSFWDIETSGQSVSDGGKGKTAKEMKQQATFMNFDFKNDWGITETQSYPYLRLLSPPLHLYIPEITGESGSVILDPPGNVYPLGTAVTLTAVPNQPKYHFTGWNGSLTNHMTISTTVLMDTHKTVTADFSINQYPLIGNPINGTITRTPSQATYSHGTEVQVTAQPNTGYHFAGWTGDVPPGNETQNHLTVFMDSTRTLTARFEPNPYHLVVRAEHGSVLQVPSLATYPYGTQVTLIPRPETGYHFTWWSNSDINQLPWWADETVDPTTSPLTLTMTADTTATAFFRRSYEIRTLSELQSMATGDLKGYYTLMNDIDASDTANWNDEGTTEGLREGFRPIGKDQDYYNSFQGVFDGNGKKIFGLTINRPREDGVGLFGSVSPVGQIKNLTLEGGSVTGNNRVGGMIGYSGGGATRVTDCATSMTVMGNGTVGGLIGNISSAEITGCIAHGPVTGGAGYAGGLIGESDYAIVRNCSATGPVIGEHIGGLIGASLYPYSQITECTASGKVTGTSPEGLMSGLVGECEESLITNCSSYCEVTGLGGCVGGLVGHCWEMTSIKDCKVSGTITAAGSRGGFPSWREELGIGGLVGIAGSYTNIEDCTILASVTGSSTGSNRANVGGLVGYAYWNNLGILRCRSEGNIVSDSIAGGLLGKNYADFCYIQDSSSIGSVTGFDNVGGIIGDGTYSSIENCTASGAITGHSNVGGLVGFH
ncbi:MAG TPA: GLUG motif-containing protein, partial [Candidatus Sumerlaeota bacterium]|nr:GLUG motif-containing protein [Candidatus Sumerlaeota bacterium]